MFCSTCEKEMSAIVVLFCVLFIHSGITEEEIGSPLRVAQCRARCTQRFIAEADYEKGCPQGSDCSMCWENCQLLQSNFPVWWRTICDERRICFPGCEEACQFHDEIGGSQREPVVQTRGEEVVELDNGLANWPRPSRASAPFIYVVMRRLGEKPWRQISQGLRPRARVPEGGLLRVLVVNRNGLVAIYSPKSSSTSTSGTVSGGATGSTVGRRISPELATAKYILQSVGRSDILAGYPVPQLPPSGKRINTQIFLPSTSVPNSILEDSRNERKRPSRKRPWNLHEVSLIHQKYLVIAEIAWEPRQQQQVESSPVRKPFYFVTWEVDGGGLKGNLLTESTAVTLSLCTDTVYHIQVEVAVRLGEVDEWSEKSEEIVVDTGRAVAVELDAASAEDASGNAASRWNQHQHNQEHVGQEQQDTRAIVRVPAWPFASDKAQFLGAVAAGSLFLALALIIVFVRTRWRRSLVNNDEPKLLPPSPSSRSLSSSSGSFPSLVHVVEESDLTNQQSRHHNNHPILPHPHQYPQSNSCISQPSLNASSFSSPSCSSTSNLLRNGTLHV